MNKVEKFWCDLTVAEKERIAAKITGAPSSYPACTDVWLSLSEERKQKICDHCIVKHGHVETMEFDGNPFTD